MSEYQLPAREAIEWVEQGIRVLRELPLHERTEHWDMNYWGIKTACGTVACAAGHMAMDKWFIAHGFNMYFPHGSDMGRLSKTVTSCFGRPAARVFHCPYKRHTSTVTRELESVLTHYRTLPPDQNVFYNDWDYADHMGDPAPDYPATVAGPTDGGSVSR